MIRVRTALRNRRVLHLRHVPLQWPKVQRRADIRLFFKAAGAAGQRRLGAVAITNPAYEEDTRYQCPLVEIVCDLFHIVARYGREVINRFRVHGAIRLRHDEPAAKVIEGAPWLLLRNRENIKKNQERIKLSGSLSANKRLATAYVIKDNLKHRWGHRYEGTALRFWCFGSA